MRIVQITPGSGDSFYCENCLRDVALVRALRDMGHDVLMVPLYLPLQSDRADSPSNAPIFFGGVNVFLQQKLKLFRKTPRWIDGLFDSRRLLAWAGRKAGMTSAKDLGETTISMLKGEDGRQVKELDRLVDWLAAADNRPDVVCLSNVLLAGLARQIKKRLGVPVVCLLQDEDDFVDGLGSPYAEQAWRLIAERSQEMDGFIAVSRYFAEAMAKRLGLGPDKVHVAYMGIEVDGYEPAPDSQAVPAIGFLSRMCANRGLDTLVEAFVILKRKDDFADLRLRVAGGKTLADEPLLSQIHKRLSSEGLSVDVDFLPQFDRATKIDFLKGLSVLCVPEKRPVAYGLYVLEALACGVPVVEPAFGVFPELHQATGGCVLYERSDASTLADALASLLLDRDKARELGARGRQAVLDKFDIRKTAQETIATFERIITQHQ